MDRQKPLAKSGRTAGGVGTELSPDISLRGAMPLLPWARQTLRPGPVAAVRDIRGAVHDSTEILEIMPRIAQRERHHPHEVGTGRMVRCTR